MAENAAALGSGGALIISSLLSLKLARLFPKSVLDAISALCFGASSGAFDPTGKSDKEVIAAVKLGRLSKSDGIEHFASKGVDLASTADASAYKKIEFAIKTLESLPPKVTATHSAVEGARLYVLAKLSTAFSSNKKGSTSFDLCVTCDSEPSSSKENSSGKSFSSSMTRPESEHFMYSLLNAFITTSHSLGLIDVLASTEMLEDIVYEPVRTGSLPWFVAFECFILYLRLLESQGSSSRYNASNIYHLSGGIDSMRTQAWSVAREFYPAAFFRTHGGNPLAPGRPDDDSKGKSFKGTLKGCNESSNIPCTAWNLEQPHLAKHVDDRGFCKFKHGICDQFVSDKGPNGRCGGNHRRKQCDYDPAKKVSQPAKA